MTHAGGRVGFKHRAAVLYVKERIAGLTVERDSKAGHGGDPTARGKRVRPGTTSLSSMCQGCDKWVCEQKKKSKPCDAGTGSPHSRFPASADQTSIIVIATAKHFDDGCRCGVCSARRVDGRQSECLLLVWCERRLKTQQVTKEATVYNTEHTKPKSKAGGAAMAWWCSCARCVVARGRVGVERISIMKTWSLSEKLCSSTRAQTTRSH
jgi:hypothetical protein